jgi:hypothetical protein
MKTRNLKKIVAAFGIATVAAGVILFATFQPSAKPTSFGALSDSSISELPALAAALVKNASLDTRETVAREVIQGTVAFAKPCVIPYVVSAVCQAVPEVAPVVAVTASRLQPQDMWGSVRAALKAAPEQADQIVYALTKEFPQWYPVVAIIAAEEAPTKTLPILQAISRAMPEVKPFIERAVAYRNNQVKVAPVLEQVQQMAAVSQREQTEESKRKAIEEILASRTSDRFTPVRMPDLPTLAKMEIAKAEATVNSPNFGMQPAPRLGPPATPKIPTPIETKIKVSDLGPRAGGGGVKYSAP